MLKPSEITTLQYITVDDVSDKWVKATQGSDTVSFHVDGDRDDVREVMQRVTDGELTIEDAD